MLGCDIVEVERISAALEKFGDRFVKRILCAGEIDIYEKRGKSIQFLSGRFAAKESVSKSFKTGIGNLAFTDIEILNNTAGAPEVYIRGERRTDIDVSISHDRHYAMAVSMIVR